MRGSASASPISVICWVPPASRSGCRKARYPRRSFSAVTWAMWTSLSSATRKRWRAPIISSSNPPMETASTNRRRGLTSSPILPRACSGYWIGAAIWSSPPSPLAGPRSFYTASGRSRPGAWCTGTTMPPSFWTVLWPRKPPPSSGTATPPIWTRRHSPSSAGAITPYGSRA